MDFRDGTALSREPFPSTPQEAAGWLAHAILAPAGLDETWRYEVHWETGSEHSWSPNRKINARGITLPVITPVEVVPRTHSPRPSLGMSWFAGGVLQAHIGSLGTPAAQQLRSELGSARELAPQYACDRTDALTVDAVTRAGAVVEALTSRACLVGDMWMGVAANDDALMGLELIAQSR